MSDECLMATTALRNVSVTVCIPDNGVQCYNHELISRSQIDDDAHAQPSSGDPNEMCDSTNLYQVPDGQGVVSSSSVFSGRPLGKRDPELQRSSISFDSQGSVASH
ncbi:hypothetical protein CDAR_6921 [Caerostris darwini]|uniref:Uncharacterized protein n=1 Tax=Caerostris darwini TaxID=1538125 RepID=A0AAV4PHS7_9ARAC|nr:hypothetical protein CDAR_6921 [Caerostris darwini]